LTGSDEEAFFDLRSDPYEMTNLITDVTLKTEIEHHRALLHDWAVSVGEKRLTIDEVKATQPAEGRRVKPNQEKKDKAPPAASAPATDE
ncbi:MAG: hypothetical protein WCK57_02955, partial [Verrucomicrobiae bacterium]